MATTSGKTFNIQRFSTEDGPGIRTTVFLKGCPLKCPWCHNPEGMQTAFHLTWTGVRCIGDRDCIRACPNSALEAGPDGIRIKRDTCAVCGACVSVCPSGALEITGREQSVEEVMDEVRRDAAFYRNSGGGLTISGGEPAMQPDFTRELLDAARAEGFHAALDTTGYAAPEVFESLARAADMVLMDLKIMDPARHREATGVPLDVILDNARRAASMGKTLWVRVPVIPGHTDSDENILAIADFIAAELPTCERLDLLPFSNLCTEKYRRLGGEFPLRDAPLITRRRMDKLKALSESRGVRCVTASGLTAIDGPEGDGA